MKLILSIILGIIVSIGLNAQDTLRIEDIFKKGRKNNNSSVMTKSMKLDNNTFDSILSKFANAFDQYVYLVNTKYHLVKDGKIYGKDSLDYYGSNIGIAIAVGKELWMDSSLVKPWTNDSDYLKVKNIYDAELSSMSLCSIINMSEIETNESGLSVNKFGIGTYKYNSKNLQSIKVHEGYCPEGMLVLYKNNTDEKNSTLTKSVHLIKPNYVNGVAELEHSNEKDIIGGFYFSINANLGSISFQLAGILSNESPNNAKWRVIQTCTNKANCKDCLSVRSESSESKSETKPIIKEIPKKKSKK